MLDIQAEQQESGQPYQELYEAVAGLKRRHRLPASAIRPRDGLALRNDAERETVQELVARFRRLPEADRRKLPALWNSLAQLEIVVGDLEAGQRDFQEVARLVRDPGSRAEAHHNVYRTALERRDWDDALAALRKAVALDAAAFEPFPWSRYEPRRILGAGGFGVSFSCRDKTGGEDVVVEALQPDGLDRPDSLDLPRVPHAPGPRTADPRPRPRRRPRRGRVARAPTSSSSRSTRRPSTSTSPRHGPFSAGRLAGGLLPPRPHAPGDARPRRAAPLAPPRLRPAPLHPDGRRASAGPSSSSPTPACR